MIAQVPARTTSDLIRLASAGAIFFSVAIPLVGLGTIAVFPPSNYLLDATAATAVYLPLHVGHVVSGLRGVRPRYLPLTLGLMAVAIISVTPLLGSDWFFAFSALIASVLITAPPRVAFPLGALILVGLGLWTGILGPAFGGTPFFGAGVLVYFPIAIAVRAATVFVLVWLVGALRRVQSARTALADAALESERDTIDIELRETVGAELEAVVAMGARAEDAFKRGSPHVGMELDALVEASRRALANARRVAGRYKLSSPSADLERAASLLRAAGIETTIELPDTPLPPTLDDSLRSALQVAVDRLLTEERAGPFVLKLESSNGEFRLETVKPLTSEPAA